MDIALFQTDIAWQNPKQNLKILKDKFENLLKPVQLVLLPEMFTTGFCTNPNPTDCGDKNKILEELIIISKDYSTSIGGSIMVYENNTFFNRFYLINENGVEISYDKRHLFRMGNEHQQYTSGKSKVIFTINNIRFSPLICYDLRFPVWSRNKNDYDVLIYVANWPSSRSDVWKKLLMARAIENQCYVLGINRVGTDGNDLYYSGNTMVVDFKGNIMAETKEFTEDVVYSSIDLNSLNEFRKKFPAWMDADDFRIID